MTRITNLCAGVLGVAVLAGCGYSFHGSLPAHMHTVFVQPFANRVDITAETSNISRYRTYRPRMELQLTNAVLERFQIDGTIRPAGADRAATLMVGELVSFTRDPLRFSRDGDPEEYRLSITANVEFRDLIKHVVVWREQVIGDTTFFERGSVSVESEVQAIDRALDDLARRIVERTVENW
jgi:outer membrane lipopolysaccharide assembly protein LptE/RlpB